MGERILIVEDDESIATEIGESLAAQGYVIVGQASSGEAAVGMAVASNPDLVLMDIQLEGSLDGVQAAERLRSLLDISVLYLTAHTEKHTVARARATAPLGYLLKPFSERELTIAVEMALARQQLEAELRAERERLNVTLRSIGDAVIATDVNSRIVLINTVAEQLTGWSSAEALGRPLSDVLRTINQQTREPCADPVKRVIESGRVVTLAKDTALIARDGTERAIADSGAPILGASNRVLGAVLVFRDISLQLKLERDMQRTQRLDSVGVLAGGIAHDFNNLITVIAANVSLATRKIVTADPDLAATLDDVLAACDRASRLTKQLLTFSSGGAPVRTRTSVADLVRTTVDFALRGSKARYSLQIAPNLWPADIDGTQVSQVITNLLINADEAMPNGGAIDVRCRNRTVTESDDLGCGPGLFVETTVTDEGSGIPPEILDRIFEPYFSTKQRGSGLGLAAAYSIVKKHGGVLGVDSQLGQGATFVVLLPAATEPLRQAPGGEDAGATDGKRRVLVMDDEVALRRAVSAILKDEGYDVQAAADGGEAVRCFSEAKAQGKPFDVVLLDLTVRHGMGGVETVPKLLAIDPKARVIATSGYATDPVLADPRKYGFMASLPKPFRGEDVARLIERVHNGGRLPD
jgi:two-component system cell cycle sensor histidine kinase/response regulator CckA